MEALRYLPFLAPEGYVVTNTTPVLNVPNYPDIEAVLNEVKRRAYFVAIDADNVAAEIGNKRASNVVMLGAATPFILISPEKIETGIDLIFRNKGEEVVELNKKAFRAGLEFALQNR
jgi:indolepyruvate ferredoxin oxidoreductase beta subunit